MYRGIIYSIECLVNNKIYIGQTINLKQRMLYHYTPSTIKFNNNSLYKDIQKYGKENFSKHILLEIVETDEKKFKKGMLQAEKDFIMKFDSIKTGYNIELGNEITTIMKKNLSQKMSGRKLSESHRRKLYGRIVSEETRKKLSESSRGEKNHNYGKHLSIETRRRMSESKKGKYKGKENPFYGKSHSKKTLDLMSKNRKGMLVGKNNPAARKIINIDTDKVFDTIKEAGIYYGIKSSFNISSVCTGKLKSSGGYRWKYV